MNNMLKRLLFGDGAIGEYKTITINDEIKESVYLKINNETVNVSQNQWLLCLYPAVFGVWLPKEDHIITEYEKTKYKMYFKGTGGNNVAALTLNFFDRIDENTGSLLLLKLNQSKIYHLSTIKTWLLYLKYYKKPQFTFNILKAFVSAYSYPRKVRVISYRQNDYYNIFPMDLLGDISQVNRFVFGLRHTNASLPLIMETKKLVVSEVDFEHKEVIYRLGSHHSAVPPPIDQLPFKVTNSEKFNFYIPQWANSYKEVSVLKTINLGSHRLLWGKVENECILKPPAGNLFHIHYLLYLYQKRKGLAYSLV
jgi:flavin reductase (DIM6/NTAB) family NADH-FMN oxidoreductase RutF